MKHYENTWNTTNNYKTYENRIWKYEQLCEHMKNKKIMKNMENYKTYETYKVYETYIYETYKTNIPRKYFSPPNS